MKCSIDNKTGLLIESQFTMANSDVMIDNARRLGYDDVEIRIVYDDEHAALVHARDNAKKTDEQRKKEFIAAIQDRLNRQAQAFGYDDINSIGKYVGYENPFRVESEALGVWAALTWIIVEQIERDIAAKLRDRPTMSEVILELPPFTA